MGAGFIPARTFFCRCPGFPPRGQPWPVFSPPPTSRPPRLSPGPPLDAPAGPHPQRRPGDGIPRARHGPAPAQAPHRRHDDPRPEAMSGAAGRFPGRRPGSQRRRGCGPGGGARGQETALATPFFRMPRWLAATTRRDKSGRYRHGVWRRLAVTKMKWRGARLPRERGCRESGVAASARPRPEASCGCCHRDNQLPRPPRKTRWVADKTKAAATATGHQTKTGAEMIPAPAGLFLQSIGRNQLRPFSQSATSPA